MGNTATKAKVSVFSIYMPIDTKKSFAYNDAEANWYVQGFASTPALDLQGDIVKPEGIDISYFVKNGYINYEHKQDAQYIVGVPTSKCYVDAHKGLFVEAKLFKNNVYAQQMWSLAQQLEENGSERNLGFSIEGKIVSRDLLDDRVIDEVVITNVALTTHPANPEATWEAFVKSLEAGHDVNPDTMENGSALRVEDFTHALTTIASCLSASPERVDSLWDAVLPTLDTVEPPNTELCTLVLQLSKGVSKREAIEFVGNREETK